MEVLPKRGALLTDAEALQSLRDCARIVNGNRDLSKLFNVQGSLWITKEIDSFCRTTPCASQSTEDIAAFLSRLETAIPGKPFSDKEKVQLVNLRPASLVE
ncbi:DNA-directed RNA polymerase III subunit RPC9, partial [Plasmodiophora brassicae]